MKDYLQLAESYLTEERDTALILAAKKNNLNRVKELIKTGANINATGDGGWTPLMNASFQGHLDIVKELLKAKAKTNLEDYTGHTALTLASEHNYPNIVKELLLANAKVKDDKYIKKIDKKWLKQHRPDLLI